MYGVSHIVKQLIRTNLPKEIVRHKRMLARRKRNVDPGIQNRKDLVSDDQEFEKLSEYDFDLEADFMNVATTHKEFVDEQRLKQEREKYFIIKQKYFKQKMPNFLTWSDKEQIRYLYNKNPEEWTIERLSEGFPAVPDVIAKIVKSTWTKNSESKIRNHDEAVKQNWALFKKGELTNLPSDVTDHLKKFSNRDLNFKPFALPNDIKENSTKSMVAPNIKIGSEFSEIIKSYDRLKNKDKDEFNKLNSVSKNNKVQKPPKEDTYLLNDHNLRKKSKHVTLDRLQQQIQKKADDGHILEEEQIMLSALKEEEKRCLPSDEKNYLPPAEVNINSEVDKKYVTSEEVGTSVKGLDKHYSAVDYPNKITIPKNKYKRGYTYKLNDCYYDDDGEFLYRVPGMY